MRTRNADGPKSAAARKTPAAKKTSEATTKATPKAASASKAAKAQQSTTRAAAAASTTAIPDSKPEVKEPVALTEDKKPADRSPPSTKVASASAAAQKVEETAERSHVLEPELEEIKEEKKANMEPDSVPDSEGEPVEVPVENEEDAAGEEQQLMEEDGGPGGFVEVAGEALVAEDGGEEVQGEGEELGEGEERDDEKSVRMEEQIEILNMAKARKMKKEHEIFVGGLDRDAVEEDLMKVFEKVGEVVEIRLHKDFNTNKNKGFAFVKFASKEQATKALADLKNPLVRGKRCGVAPSEDNDTLFLGNICNTWTKEAIRNKLKDYGIDGVEKITLVADTQNEGLSRGFAFLEFACHADAMLAYKRLQKPDAIFGHPERTAKVAFAEPLHEPDPEVMAQVKSVFVDGLPPYWDEDQVKEQFKVYGEIERVALARNMSKAKRKDFGFVNFATHEAAVACANGINDTELGDGKSKMKARARLANPFPKTQAVKGGMSGGFRIGYFNIGRGGFGRGGFIPHRTGFRGGRGFHHRGRGRGGRISFPADHNLEAPYAEFHGRRPFGLRGGRRGSIQMSHNTFNRGRMRGFPGRRPPLIPGEFDRPFGARHFDEDPYFLGGIGPGIKRSFSTMEHDSGYLDPGSRIRSRYDHPDPLSGGPSYRESLGMSGFYSHEYYGSEYGGSPYSSFYGGEHSGGGYFY